MCFRTVTIIIHKGSDARTEVIYHDGDKNVPWGNYPAMNAEDFHTIFANKAYQLLAYTKVKELVHSISYECVLGHRRYKWER